MLIKLELISKLLVAMVSVGIPVANGLAFGLSKSPIGLSCGPTLAAAARGGGAKPGGCH